RKRAYCLKIQPATGSFARNLIYSTKPLEIPKKSWNQDIVNSSAMLDVSLHDWTSALAYWDNPPSCSEREFINYIRCFAELEWIPALTYNLNILQEKHSIQQERILIATAWRDR
ncbi:MULTISPECIES: hypothetical protein, partial [unclassified Enterobacter]